jgi:carboxyl-terminal processing protease
MVAELTERTGLALTSGQYFTPSGRSIQRPLPGTALTFASLDQSATPKEKPPHATGDPKTAATPAFHTEDGRPVTTGGGITPDVTISKRSIDPWLAFIIQRGYMTSYAEEYLTTHGKVDESFQPPPEMMENFRDNLLSNGVRVPEEYWAADQDYLRLHIKVELINLIYGLERGDQVETKGDPQAQQAAALLPRVKEILKPH